MIYGLGGYLALQGELEAGTVVTLALLLNRLYGPLTALATARLDVVTALVSFDRVFEVLDVEPLVAEAEAPVAVPPGPVGIELDHVHFRYPSADQVSLASLEEVAVLDEPRGPTCCTACRSRCSRARRSRWWERRARASPPSLARAAAVRRRRGSVRLGGVDVRDLSFASIRDTVGVVTQDGHLFHDTIAANLRYAAPAATPTTSSGRRAMAARAGRGWSPRCPTASTPSSASAAIDSRW